MAGLHAVGPWLVDLVAGTELVKQAVNQPAAVLQKVRIGRIAHLGVAAGGIHLQRASVVVAVLIGLLFLRITAVCLRKHQSQHVEEGVV